MKMKVKVKRIKMKENLMKNERKWAFSKTHRAPHSQRMKMIEKYKDIKMN